MCIRDRCNSFARCQAWQTILIRLPIDSMLSESLHLSLIHISFQWYAVGSGGFLMAALDFLNEPGIFRLQYAYKPKGLTERLAWIEFRVVSPKLDTKRDLMHMMSMINAEYENLVFKYLTKTFQSLSLSSGQGNEMIWLSIFKSVIDEYITALEFVTNRPNTRGERITRCV